MFSDESNNVVVQLECFDGFCIDRLTQCHPQCHLCIHFLNSFVKYRCSFLFRFT